MIAYGTFALASLLLYFGLPSGIGIYAIAGLIAIYAVAGLISAVVLTPINLYRALAKDIDSSPQFTDQITLEFSSSRLVFIGPNWRCELPWTTFRGFSEDELYFYLQLSDNRLASVLPKSAFTAEQQGQFRQYAKSCSVSIQSAV